MRLSEKSIELNFCHQLSSQLGQPAWWFGTTQRQERDAGWDVPSKIAGSWIRFQLKASKKVLKSGDRRFRGHHQLVELQVRATHRLAVFYVLPTIGTTSELMYVKFNLLDNLRFLDVHAIPPISAPTTRSGSVRKSELHYYDLNSAGTAVTIHSDPVTVPVMSVDVLGADVRESALGQEVDIAPEEAASANRTFLSAGRHRVAVFLPG
jgi:hypothetical protein